MRLLRSERTSGSRDGLLPADCSWIADFSTLVRCKASEEAFNNSLCLQGRVVPPSVLRFKSVGSSVTWIIRTSFCGHKFGNEDKIKSGVRQLRLVNSGDADAVGSAGVGSRFSAAVIRGRCAPLGNVLTVRLTACRWVPRLSQYDRIVAQQQQ